MALRKQNEAECKIMVVGEKDSGMNSIINSLTGANLSSQNKDLGETLNAKIIIEGANVNTKVMNGYGFMHIHPDLPDAINSNNVNSIVVTVDMTSSKEWKDNHDTLVDLNNWLNDINRAAPGIPIVIIGTKSDDPHKTNVHEDNVSEFLEAYSILHSTTLYKFFPRGNVERAFASAVSQKLEIDKNKNEKLLSTIKDCLEECLQDGRIPKTEGTKDILKIAQDNAQTPEQKLAGILNIATHKKNSSSMFSHTDTKANSFFHTLSSYPGKPEKITEELMQNFPSTKAPKVQQKKISGR